MDRLGPLNPIAPPATLSPERRVRWCHARTRLDEARARRRGHSLSPRIVRRLLSRRLARAEAKRVNNLL